MAEPLKVHQRWMIRRDMAEVLSIEGFCFEYPWNEEDFLKCLRQRNVIGWVAEANELVLGFMVYEIQKSHFWLLNFAVHPDYQRRGIGRQLVEKMLGKMSESTGRTSINIKIRESNYDAQFFFREMGFLCTQIVNDAYSDNDEAAYIFNYKHPKAAAVK